jgi:hypothetical protein
LLTFSSPYNTAFLYTLYQCTKNEMMFTPKSCQTLLLLANEHLAPQKFIESMHNNQNTMHLYECVKQDCYAIKRAVIKVTAHETKSLLSRIHKMDKQTAH